MEKQIKQLLCRCKRRNCILMKYSYFSLHSVFAGCLFAFTLFVAPVKSQTLLSFRITNEQNIVVPNVILNVSACGKNKMVKTNAEGLANIKVYQKESLSAEVKVSIRSKFYHNIDTPFAYS